MDTLIKDIRYAIRSLLKRPGFVAVAVITLALGIGANTAIFSLVNTVLLRSLPVERAGEIVSVAMRGKDDSMSAFSYPNYRDFRDRNETLSGLAGLSFRAAESESRRRERTYLGLRSFRQLLRRARREGDQGPHVSSRRRQDATVESRRRAQLRLVATTLRRRSGSRRQRRAA